MLDEFGNNIPTRINGKRNSEYMKRHYQLNREKYQKLHKDYYNRNRDKVLEYEKQWQINNKIHTLQYIRNNYLRLNGRAVHCKKRLNPLNNKCELCNKTGKRIYYHHWDDNDLTKGIWVCCKCHRIIESIDDLEFTKKITNKYLNLKAIIEYSVSKVLNTKTTYR